MIQLPPITPAETDYKIAEYVMEEIEDGCCLIRYWRTTNVIAPILLTVI